MYLIDRRYLAVAWIEIKAVKPIILNYLVATSR